MNIAIFSPNQNPYSETFVQAHKNYLKGKVFYYYGRKGRIQLEGQDRLISKTRERRYRLIRKLNKKSYSYINDKAILDSLKFEGIDVILVEYGTHAHNLYEVLKASGLPVAVHFHGYDASVKVTIDKCGNYKDVFSLASRVIAVSRKMKEMLLNLGCPPEKLFYNVYGPQPEFEAVKPAFTKKQFIGIGRFTDKKAPYYTILAFKEVARIHPDARLLLAGDGILLNMCKNLVRQFRLEDQVEFLGVITADEYRQFLSESLSFVQHSITAENGDMEGTPLAVLEASVAGLPVISTKHAGIPDVIEHGVTGLLCDEHDITAMTNNMLLVLDDVSYAQKLGAASKLHVLKNFSMQRHIQSLQNVLEEVVKVQ